jgi:hypothetical protein
MDVMSRCRLFRSSWFTTSASNGRACPAVDRRFPPVARSAHGTATSRARRIAALDEKRLFRFAWKAALSGARDTAWAMSQENV